MSVANILTSDKEFTNLPQVKTESLTLRGTLGNAVFTTNSTGTQAFINGQLIETGGIPVWVGNATTDLDMNQFDIKDADTVEANVLVLKDNGGIAVIKYDQPTNDLQIGCDTFVDGDLDATALLVSDPATVASKATFTYSDATQTVTLDKKFDADEVIANTLTMVDGVTTASLTYNTANNEIEASGSTALFGQNVRALGEIQIGDLTNIARITHELPADVVNIDHPLTVDGSITATGAISGTAISGTSIAGGTLTGSSLDVGAGSVTCGTVNYTTLNPPIVSGWIGTATSDLNMAGYDIKTTVGTLDLTNATNIINIDGTAVHLKVAGADELVANGTEVSVYKDLNMTTNDITNVGTITATTTVATTAKATNTQLVDSGNQVIELKKSAGLNYPVYSAPASGVATASLLDDTNNKPTLSFNSTTDVLTLSAKDVAGNTTVLSTVDITTALDRYIPLTGTAVGQSVTGAVVFENTANIQCEDIQTGFISALPTVGFVSVEDPLQTRVLGVRSEDGTAPALIAMALSESAVPPEILEMTYNPLGNDKLEINKGLILDGGLIMGAGGGFNNIENALNIYASDTIEGQTLQAIDYIQGSANVVVKTIDPVFTNNEIAKISYPDATAQNAVITAQGAVNLTDPPNGGLPANIYINGLDVKQTLDFIPTNEIFVAKNGSDSTGNGSSLQPYATIPRAIQDADAITPKTGVCVIQIANGTYSEPIFITGANSGFIQLNGQSTSQNNAFGVVIDGAIYIQMNSGTSDLISRQVILSGLQIRTVLNTSTVEHTVIIQNCRLYPTADLNGISIQDFNTATANRCLVDNCEYTNDYPSASPSPCFNFTGNTTISFTNCDIQSPNNADIFSIAGTSYFQRLENCYIESQFVNPTSALVDIISTSSSTHNIGLNVFSFKNSTSTTAPAIFTQAGGTLFVVSNNFNLSGTNPTTGNVIQYSGTAPTLLYKNNSAVIGTASGIQSGITLAPLTTVGSEPIKATTINATSGTIASTTMTGNTQTVVGTGQGVVAKTVQNGATVLNGRVNISGSSSGIALNVNTGSSATNVIELNGGTLGINGASNLKFAQNTISNTSNNTAITGVNSLTMAGSLPQISGVNGLTFGALGFISNINSMTFGGANSSISSLNSLSITNSNATVPLRITNSGDNPNVIIEATTGSDAIPVEFTMVNGAITCAIGNQRSSPRGFFTFVNGADAVQISNLNRRVTQNYSPSSPCFALSGVNGAWVAGTTGVAFTSTVPYLIGTQTITLSQNNFPIPANSGATQAYMGLQGTVSYKLNGNHELATSVFVTRTRSGITLPPVLLYGAVYNTQSTNSGFMTQVVNGISYNESIPANSILFQNGDIVTFTVYATYTGGSPPSMTVAPVGMSSVISPVFF